MPVNNKQNFGHDVKHIKLSEFSVPEFAGFSPKGGLNADLTSIFATKAGKELFDQVAAAGANIKFLREDTEA